MKQQLSFPKLGIDLEIPRIAFSIGPIDIYWYGIIIAVGFALALIYAMRRVKKFGLDGDRVIDVVLGAVVGGIAGARLYYVLFTWDEYKNDLLSIFDTRKGGMAIYGGIIGAFLVGALMCKLRKVKFLPLCDLAAGGFFIGQAIGRWGNFVNVEAFGGNTSLPWGMTSETISRYLLSHESELTKIGMTIDVNAPVHPTFLYESLWCVIGFFILQAILKRRRFDGEGLLFYILWYGAGRFVIEGLRTDSLMIGALRVSQMFALLCCVASAVIWILVRSKIRRVGDPEYMKLYVDTEEGKAVVAGTYYPKLKEEAAARKAQKALKLKDESKEEPIREEPVQEDGEEDGEIPQEPQAEETAKEAEDAASSGEEPLSEEEPQEDSDAQKEDIQE